MVTGWRNARYALCLVATAACVTAVYARLIDQPFWLGLYNYNFAFVPGDWVANRLNDAEQDPRRTCLFVGTSVVREGIDPSVIEAEVPGIRVVNIGTTGGYSAADVIEIQARIVAQRGNHYRCIVVGLNKFYLRDPLPGAYELMVSDYAGQLSIASLFALSGREQLSRQAKRLALKQVTPLRKHSLIIQRIVRNFMADLHAKYVGRLGLADYELFKGELKSVGQYRYPGPSIYDQAVPKAAKALRDLHMEESTSYESPIPRSALSKALQTFATVTDNLYIVHMPLTSTYEKAEAAASAAYIAAATGAPVSHTIECDVPNDRERLYFYDSSHLLARGREQFSRDIGALLDADLNGASAQTEFCRTSL